MFIEEIKPKKPKRRYINNPANLKAGVAYECYSVNDSWRVFVLVLKDNSSLKKMALVLFGTGCELGRYNSGELYNLEHFSRFTRVEEGTVYRITQQD